MIKVESTTDQKLNISIPLKIWQNPKITLPICRRMISTIFSTLHIIDLQVLSEIN
jgi:hypothetical protein